MKQIWEYKLELLFHGVSISQNCYKLLKKDKNGKVNQEDYITTKGLILVLNDSVYVNAMINKNSSYRIDYEKSDFVLKFNDEKVCFINIIQPPDFALNAEVLPNGKLITDLVNVHGDRVRIQPIQGCANRCKFCDINKSSYFCHSVKDLEDAFIYAQQNVGFRHVLISGGSPLNTEDDYNYLNEVYKYFGEKYGKEYPIDIMMAPRGFSPKENNRNGYMRFLKQLKSWNISGLSVNLELYNNYYRKEYIPQKDLIGKDNYFTFLKQAVEIFGKENVRSCIIVGLEDVSDTIKAVEELSEIGCMPVLSPYVPNDDETTSPTPEIMKDVLLKSKEIVDKYNVELGPICDSCKHNTIHFK